MNLLNFSNISHIPQTFVAANALDGGDTATNGGISALFGAQTRKRSDTGSADAPPEPGAPLDAQQPPPEPDGPRAFASFSSQHKRP